MIVIFIPITPHISFDGSKALKVFVYYEQNKKQKVYKVKSLTKHIVLSSITIITPDDIM